MGELRQKYPFMKKTFHTLISLILSLSPAFLIFSCSRSPLQEELDFAETRMETRPDSALSILKGIDKSALNSNKDRARYALLMSMALDKNYIDTTSFDILQPAIDYYLEKGTPDEKLRTYYYQGRIFQNQGNKESALNAFMKGIETNKQYTDSLLIIRTLVAQAYLLYEFYDFYGYTTNNLKAADLSHLIQKKDYEYQCLLNGLNGSLILDNKLQTDSLMSLCRQLSLNNDNQKLSLLPYELRYAIKYESPENIKPLIDKTGAMFKSTTEGQLNLALAYNKIGDNILAQQLLDSVKNSRLSYDTLKHKSIQVSVYRDSENYKEALNSYFEFHRLLDKINVLKMYQKSKSIEEKYKLEIAAQNDARKKSRVIWGCLICITGMMMITLLLYFLARSRKAEKDLTLQKMKIAEIENEKLKSDKQLISQKALTAQLENERLESERERLALENKYLKLERNNKALEAENLAHRVEILEAESDSLKSLIETRKELPEEVQTTIKKRIEMLNALLANYITNNTLVGSTYEAWLKKITDNAEEFMNYNKMAFQASHPQFIRFFENHGLTEKEIQYVCLYAIGLNGKEVGNYIKKRGHVNISSAIRKKLGMNTHSTNLGLYVLKLLKTL